ncbi:hypothetical protein LO772_07850 [Yinghuangia sp. ASG 101]|uniref:SCO6880 family protein n=1 Tax=Yinghuangia sp. ASG 101 TaxID=2896848 RepID=UPI001E3AFD7E|nr:SCO6880 family protein [Yinghuangia sp. ASG 101]UGQ13509.1 hypothetical protein LO772_07850 [Yinghuangia sp. ASG 101]
MPDTDIRTYGNWRKPSSPGIGRLGLGGSLLVLAALGLVIVTMMVSTMLALFIAVVATMAVVPLMMRDKHGRSGLQWVGSRLAWLWGSSQGQHLYQAGVLGRIPGSVSPLPGIGATLELFEAEDAYGQPFALTHCPATRTYTVVLETSADGASLVDSEQVDLWVAHWGRWLAVLAHEPRLAAASATIETAPDTGVRLRREVVGNLDPSAPQVAQEVLHDIVQDYPVGSAEITSRIALTYVSEGTEGDDEVSVAEMAEEIALRLPGLAEDLAMTGAGMATPMTAHELTEAVRFAYDPAAALLAESHGADPLPLSWDEVGPVGAYEAVDHYRHDGAFSITWSMTEAPRGEVFSSVLNRLVAPHPDIVRKRVTLLYRPHSPAEAARLVERDRKDALFKAQQARIEQARDSVELMAADQSASEEATGAGLVRFGLLVTATVLDEAALAPAAAAVGNLAAGARVLLRRAYGAQASTFAGALPLGLVLAEHLRIPQRLRNAM